MPLTPDFDQICQEFLEFRNLITKVRPSAAEAHVQARLDELTAKMDKAFAEFTTEYPQAVAGIDKQIADTNSQIARTQNSIAATQAEIAAAEREVQFAAERAQALATPGVAPPSVSAAVEADVADPQYGQKLRQELLDRYGPKRAAVKKTDREREIWEDWDEAQ